MQCKAVYATSQQPQNIASVSLISGSPPHLFISLSRACTQGKRVGLRKNDRRRHVNQAEEQGEIAAWQKVGRFNPVGLHISRSSKFEDNKKTKFCIFVYRKHL